MRKATETLSRQWLIMQKVPAYPRHISTKDIHDLLRAEGHDTNLRTTQRDLDRLCNDFPLAGEKIGRTNYWQWARDARTVEIPSMTPATALVFQLVGQYLGPLLPRTTLKLLKPYMDRSSVILAATRFQGWRKNVRMLSRGPSLIPPVIKENVREVVYTALLEHLQFSVRYAPRNSDKAVNYTVNPLALVVREGVTYLVATLWDYDDIKHLALHRMTSPRLTNEKARRVTGFDLDRYIEQEASFGYPVTPGTLQIKVRFQEAAAFHLRESRLSTDQTLELDGADHVTLTATVPDNSEIRWWLLGFGDQAEVLEPKKLRNEFSDSAKSMAKIYS